MCEICGSIIKYIRFMQIMNYWPWEVFTAINTDPILPNLKQSSLYNLLKELDFEFIQRNRENIIVDRDDIVLYRGRYLHKIRELR